MTYKKIIFRVMSLKSDPHHTPPPSTREGDGVSASLKAPNSSDSEYVNQPEQHTFNTPLLNVAKELNNAARDLSDYANRHEYSNSKEKISLVAGLIADLGSVLTVLNSECERSEMGDGKIYVSRADALDQASQSITKGSVDILRQLGNDNISHDSTNDLFISTAQKITALGDELAEAARQERENVQHERITDIPLKRVAETSYDDPVVAKSPPQPLIPSSN